MSDFTHYIGIDWSGARGKRHQGIVVAKCGGDGSPPILVTPPSGNQNWSRIECGEWIASGCGLKPHDHALVGIDAAFGMPFEDIRAYLPGEGLSKNARELWRKIAQTCDGSEDYFGGPFVDLFAKYYQQDGGRKGSNYIRRLRVAEKKCIDTKTGPCESVFNLVGASQVGKSALSTMNMLHDLTEFSNVSIWPFEEMKPAGVCLVEIYAAVFAKLGGHKGKMRDIEALNDVLSNIGSHSYEQALPRNVDDVTDAIVTSAGLRFIADESIYWYPPALSTKVRRTEGWIFGVL